MVTVYIENKKVLQNLARLPKVIQTAGVMSTRRYANKLKKTIQRNAPEATGFLKENINVETFAKKTVIIVGAPYASLLEFGFASHRVPQLLIDLHYSSPGSTFMKKYTDMGLTYKDVASSGVTWSVWKGPFIRPALYDTLKDLKIIGEEELKKALKLNIYS